MIDRQGEPLAPLSRKAAAHSTPAREARAHMAQAMYHYGRTARPYANGDPTASGAWAAFSLRSRRGPCPCRRRWRGCRAAKRDQVRPPVPWRVSLPPGAPSGGRKVDLPGDLCSRRSAYPDGRADREALAGMAAGERHVLLIVLVVVTRQQLGMRMRPSQPFSSAANTPNACTPDTSASNSSPMNCFIYAAIYSLSMSRSQLSAACSRAWWIAMPHPHTSFRL